MIDLTNETALPLTQACRLAGRGRGGRPVHLSTLLRWILTGCRGPGGRRIHLEAVRLGSRWVTTAEALQRFAEALTPKVGPDDRPMPRTPTARRRASERAARRLERAGI